MNYFDTGDVGLGTAIPASRLDMGGAQDALRVPPKTNFFILVSARDTDILCPRYTLELLDRPCSPPRLRIAPGAMPGSLVAQWSRAASRLSVAIHQHPPRLRPQRL